MTTAPPPNSRASLLAGLRTGGVRSTSASIPHTAAPGGAFNLPRFASQHHSAVFPEEGDDQVLEMPPSNIFANSHHGGARTMPMTAAVDGPNNRFSQQQRGMNPNSVPFSPGFAPNTLSQPNQAQAQAFQLQMMQLELMKIQALQAQQYQADLLVKAQRQQQQQQQHQSQPQVQNKRLNPGFNPPATAGPLSTSFDLRSATLSAQMRRANQAEQLRSQLGIGSADQVPMTAALGGKFGSRSASVNAPVSRISQEENEDLSPQTPNTTTVISGGTSLGSPASNNISFNNNAPSKSDSVSSWRRGGNNNSVLSGNRSFTSPSVKITPPPAERVSPPPSATPSIPSTATPNIAVPKFRPQPLRFSAAVSQPLPVVAVDSSDMIDNDDSSSNSSSKSNSNSSPTTPRSSSSNEMPLSPREEASKKLYEGLGIGRPASAVGGIGHPVVTVSEHVDGEQQSYQLPASVLVSHRMASQPMRQPRGPPSGADELGPKNFATRIRRKAIGGLGMLMGARERREFVEAY